MRLERVRQARSLKQMLQLVLAPLGDTETDLNRAMMFRPEFFGAAFSSLLHELSRGDSQWTLAERELIATFVSRTNGCRF